MAKHWRRAVLVAGFLPDGRMMHKNMRQAEHQNGHRHWPWNVIIVVRFVKLFKRLSKAGNYFYEVFG
jgi:hypothetical protein